MMKPARGLSSERTGRTRAQRLPQDQKPPYFTRIEMSLNFFGIET
jgi:hypothetical protein